MLKEGTLNAPVHLKCSLKETEKKKNSPRKRRSNSLNGFHATDKYYNSSFMRHVIRLFGTSLRSSSILLLIQVFFKSLEISINDTTVR